MTSTYILVRFPDTAPTFEENVKVRSPDTYPIGTDHFVTLVGLYVPVKLFAIN